MTDFIYLNNWDREQPATRFDHALANSGLSVKVYRTVRGELPDRVAIEEACGVFVSASVAGAYDPEPWIPPLCDSLRALAQKRIPMLGLCFGSQVLAWALVGTNQVFKRQDRETGYAEIHLTQAGLDDSLTKGFDQTLRTFHWHGDEVRADHPDVLVLADNPVCANQIWRWRHGPVWGLQPHPEMDETQIREFLEKNRAWFASEGKDVDVLLKNLEPNDKLSPVFDRFLGLVKNPQLLEA